MLDDTKWYYIMLDKKFMKKTIWLFLFSSTRQILAIPDNTLIILSNSKEYLTNLLSVVNTWYQFVLTIHQVLWPKWIQYHRGIMTIRFWQSSVCLVSLQHRFLQSSQNLFNAYTSAYVSMFDTGKHFHHSLMLVGLDGSRLHWVGHHRYYLTCIDKAWMNLYVRVKHSDPTET
jgi:hypothetical protein